MLGRKVVRGHAGRNRVRFSGRLGRRFLAPGAYSITIVVHRGQTSRRVGTIGIEVISARRMLTKAERSARVSFSCSSASPVLAELVLPTSGTSALRPGPGGSIPPRKTRSSGVLGAELPTRIFPPAPYGRLGTAIALVLLGLMGLALAALLVYGARFMRGTWNP